MSQVLIAQLSIDDASGEASWLATEGSPPFQAIDPIDLDASLLDRVFELYTNTYSTLGPPFLTESHALLRFNRWVVFYDGDGRSPEHIIAVALFEVTPCGVKGRLQASDLSKKGREAVKTFAVAAYNTAGIFAEISDRLEKAIIHRVPVVPFRDASLVMRKLGHSINDAGDNHYTRRIQGTPTKKIMVGRPEIPDDQE